MAGIVKCHQSILLTMCCHVTQEFKVHVTQEFIIGWVISISGSECFDYILCVCLSYVGLCSLSSFFLNYLGRGICNFELEFRAYKLYP